MPNIPLFASILSLPLLLASSSYAATQVTWVVDDDGGPGVDFLTIRAAVAAAGPLDFVDVQPGTYGPFAMSSPTRLMGRPGVTVNGESTIQSVDADEWALVADMTIEKLTVASSEGAIILDGLTLFAQDSPLTVTECDDVRAKGLEISLQNGRPGQCVEVIESRFQLVASTVIAGGPSSQSVDGQHAVVADGTSFVHLSDSTLVGGDAGDRGPSFGPPGGDGGDALHVLNGANVRVVRSTLLGGAGGFSDPVPAEDGQHGSGIYQCGGECLIWRNTITGGTRPFSFAPPAPPIDLQCGASLVWNETLPSLRLLSEPVPGGDLLVRVQGLAGDTVSLMAGRAPARVPSPTTLLERLVTVGRFVPLGTVNGDERLDLTLSLPSWPRGTVYFLQAAGTGMSGLTDLSNSATILLR